MCDPSLTSLFAVVPNKPYSRSHVKNRRRCLLSQCHFPLSWQCYPGRYVRKKSTEVMKGYTVVTYTRYECHLSHPCCRPGAWWGSPALEPSALTCPLLSFLGTGSVTGQRGKEAAVQTPPLGRTVGRSLHHLCLGLLCHVAVTLSAVGQSALLLCWNPHICAHLRPLSSGCCGKNFLSSSVLCVTCLPVTLIQSLGSFLDRL